MFDLFAVIENGQINEGSFARSGILALIRHHMGDNAEVPDHAIDYWVRSLGQDKLSTRLVRVGLEVKACDPATVVDYVEDVNIRWKKRED